MKKPKEQQQSKIAAEAIAVARCCEELDKGPRTTVEAVIELLYAKYSYGKNPRWHSYANVTDV